MTPVEVRRIDADFVDWDGLLALIMRSFAFMDGVIDPPSSAHRLTPALLAAKAGEETGFLAIVDGVTVGCVFAARRGECLYVGKLERVAPNTLHSAEDGLGQGRGVGRSSGWWPGGDQDRRIWPKPTRPFGFPFGGRPRRRMDLADEPHRPAPSFSRIAPPNEKQNEPDWARHALAVAPERQGMGIGRRLMEAVEAHARRTGMTALELQARIELASNHAAFSRMGFAEVERTAHPGFDRPTAITMRKPLP